MLKLKLINMKKIYYSNLLKKVVTSKDGVKTFAVDGFFGDEQNSKIIQLADQYISMMQKPDGDKDYWIGLKELKATVSNIKTENLAQMEAGTSAVAWGRVGELAKQYLATPEGQAIKSDPNKEFEFNEMLGEVSKAGARKDAMLRIAENPNALLKLKAGDVKYIHILHQRDLKMELLNVAKKRIIMGNAISWL
jgi:hypothetical protein